MISGDTRNGFLAKVNAASGWMFSQTERMNREVTTIAAYDLELAKLKKQGITGAEAEQRAADHAVYTTQHINGSTSSASAPRIAQSSLGKALYMFKNYGVTQYYMLFHAAKQALKGESPEVRKAAWQQLGGIVGMTALMAGAQGIPMFGALSMVYAMFNDDDDDDLDTATRRYLGEFLYKGPIEYFTNLSIASRIGLSDMIVRDTKGGASASTFSEQVAQALGGPILGVADRIKRGYSKIAEGHFERGMEDILPSSLANVLKAGRYATEGTTTLRGDPITGDVNAWNVAAQAFGFAPADYTRQLEENSRLAGISKSVTTEVTQLKRRYYTASRVGDAESKEADKQRLLEIGAKHPGLGINAGTINDVLEKSRVAQERTTKKMFHGITLNDKLRKELIADDAEMND
jgi:hypothetical protein